MSKLNDTFEKISGIYKISNNKTNLIYIGSSNNLKRRLHRHFYELSHNVHRNFKMQKDFNRYGLDTFDVEILITFKIITIQELREQERIYVEKYNSLNNGYNLVPVENFNFTHEQLSEYAKKANKDRMRKVLSFNKDTGEFIKEFNSISLAAKFYQTSSSNISGVCKGKINYIKGCVFAIQMNIIKINVINILNPKKVISKDTRKKLQKSCKRNQPVYKYTLDKVLIQTYISRAECERCEGFKKEFLRRRLPYKTCNFIFSKDILT